MVYKSLNYTFIPLKTFLHVAPSASRDTILQPEKRPLRSHNAPEKPSIVTQT